MPNKERRTGRLVVLPSWKLINQLDEIVFVLAALMAVSVIETGLRPVISVISADKISGFTGIMEYWLPVSRPTFLGILVTR
jgi:hypothetical protein